jgi:antitoxin CcdA
MGERVTVELDSESIAAAQEAGIDLSQLLTEALHRRLPMLHAAQREADARKWYEENKEAIDAHNQFIAKHGLFSDRMRKF